MPTWSALSFQDSASPSMEQLMFFHDTTMMIITLITILIGLNMILISYIKLTDRFLVQSQTTEIIWTLMPIFILLFIALPSLQALYLLDDSYTPNITFKSTGHQWYWSYEYPDFNNISFDSYMLPMDPSLPMNRLLEVDNAIVLPSFQYIRALLTSTDVIHSWAIPSLGLKMDAMPGRLNQTTFYMNRSGLFYGQCSEICGSNHSFMPIKMESIPLSFFYKWVSSN
uniref:cytochrome c oxidase subunit II n=1 Tax=Cyphocaris challengeri TaxID=3018532 RepID=UPI0022FDAB75|nr:cytochrome c oxidase subunit II [Cyphocaris challengeri]WBQ48834.1 cytochrome c oxidase subunit II [Cyphocaris challengeri]